MKIFRRLLNLITFLILAFFEVIALCFQAIDCLRQGNPWWSKKLLRARVQEFKETTINFIRSGFLTL